MHEAWVLGELWRVHVICKELLNIGLAFFERIVCARVLNSCELVRSLVNNWLVALVSFELAHEVDSFELTINLLII